jgi:glycine/D-amino acid oxidase-like deaminating enzyme
VEVQFNQDLCLKANKIHFATNGFAASLFPDLDVKPARAQVLVTEPIAELKLNGTFHIDEGFYYFRNIDNRVLLGGGRNLDVEGETTSVLETTELIQTKLESLLGEVILPDQKVKIAHRWSGVMGVGETKKVIIERFSDKVSCSVRLGGMGVAIGTSIGKQSAQMLA